MQKLYNDKIEVYTDGLNGYIQFIATSVTTNADYTTLANVDNKYRAKYGITGFINWNNSQTNKISMNTSGAIFILQKVSNAEVRWCVMYPLKDPLY